MTSLLVTGLKALTTVSSIAIYLSEIPSIWRIWKSQSTGDMQVLPFVCMFGCCHIW